MKDESARWSSAPMKVEMVNRFSMQLKGNECSRNEMISSSHAFVFVGAGGLRKEGNGSLAHD